ncbi:MFS transporter [Gulosibacter sp. 10]|uniref:MFS transporter n=1 Tax=Gulosibacter sp. 10 TaxID=1255570 RepID=UPI00097E8A18|nr:MFS transporter [Gulosibacter sp. 10]SJM60094.1 MFS transporter [Gulosibacter sp. 10]
MSAPAPGAPRRAPGILLVVLMVAMAAGPVFNFALSALSATIIDEFSISEGRYGILLSVVFVSAGLTSAFVGAAADRIGPRAQILIILGGALLAFVVGASFHNYWLLVLAALIVGPTQAFSNPFTNRIIASRVPLRQRSAWMGWKQSGVQMGMLIAGLSFPVIAAAAGWRGAALAGAGMCAAGLVLAWIVISRLSRIAPELERKSPAADTRSASTAGGRMPAAVWLFALVSFLNAVGTQGVNAFASLFAVHAMGYPITIAGLMLGVVGVIGILSRIGWGRATGRWGRPAVLVMVMSLGGVLGLLFLVAAERTQLDALMWVGVAFHAVLPLAANVVINSGIVAAAPEGRVGIASGLVSAGMYLGFALGPAVMGAVVDVTGEYAIGWGLVGATYIGCFAVALVLARLQRRSS